MKLFIPLLLLVILSISCNDHSLQNKSELTLKIDLNFNSDVNNEIKQLYSITDEIFYVELNFPAKLKLIGYGNMNKKTNVIHLYLDEFNIKPHKKEIKKNPFINPSKEIFYRSSDNYLNPDK